MILSRRCREQPKQFENSDMKMAHHAKRERRHSYGWGAKQDHPLRYQQLLASLCIHCEILSCSKSELFFLLCTSPIWAVRDFAESARKCDFFRFRCTFSKARYLYGVVVGSHEETHTHEYVLPLVYTRDKVYNLFILKVGNCTICCFMYDRCVN